MRIVNCVRCMGVNKEGYSYSYAGKSGWVCNECVRGEIRRSSLTRRIILVLLMLLALGLGAALLAEVDAYYNNAEIWQRVIINLHLQSLVNSTGVRQPSIQQDLRIAGFVLIGLAIVLAFLAVRSKPSFNKKSMQAAGRRLVMYHQLKI